MPRRSGARRCDHADMGLEQQEIRPQDGREAIDDLRIGCKLGDLGNHGVAVQSVPVVVHQPQTLQAWEQALDDPPDFVFLPPAAGADEAVAMVARQFF